MWLAAILTFGRSNWRLVLAGLALAAGLGLLIHERHVGADGERKAEAARLVAEQKRIAGREVKASAISEHVASDLSKARVEIQYRTKTLIEKVPTYVTPSDDAECRVPVGFVRLLDAAAQGSPASLPAAPSGPEQAASGIPLSTVAESVVGNYGVAYDWRAEVLAWREWYTAQKKAWDAKP